MIWDSSVVTKVGAQIAQIAKKVISTCKNISIDAINVITTCVKGVFWYRVRYFRKQDKSSYSINVAWISWAETVAAAPRGNVIWDKDARFCLGQESMDA